MSHELVLVHGEESFTKRRLRLTVPSRLSPMPPFRPGSVELTSNLTPRASRECLLTPLNPRYPTLLLTLHQEERFRFGRHKDCEQSFPNDFRISGVHATLVLEGRPASSAKPTIRLEDSSVNGTFVNGTRMPRKSQRTLASGDEIFFVIPNEKLLQQGYAGSLTTNFVGYFFEYADAPLQAAAMVPSLGGRLEALGSETSPWGRAGSPRTPKTPHVPPDTPHLDTREDEVRQTADAPSWLAQVNGGPRRTSHGTHGHVTPRPSTDVSVGSPNLDDGERGGPEDEQAARTAGSAQEATSFALWWLQQPTLSCAPPIR